MPEAGIRIDAGRLNAFATAVYAGAGMPEADARLLADTLVQSDLWGHQSHGVLRLGWYLERLQNKVMDPVTKPEFVVDAGAMAVIDGHDGVGHVLTMLATREAVKRAKQHGIAAVGVRMSNHFGTCMYYTRMGAAIRQATQLMGQCKQKRKLLLLVTDGKPNDLDLYEGRYGVEDTREAVLEARRAGLLPFCITIDQQGGTGDSGVFKREPHGGCDICSAGRPPQRALLVELLKLLVAQHVAGEGEARRYAHHAHQRRQSLSQQSVGGFQCRFGQGVT